MAVNLEFEDKLWAMADKLRGNFQPGEYKDVVLGLIFLKYISDSFEEKYKALVEEVEEFEEDRDAYMAENVFFVPPSARWGFIKKSAKLPEIGQIIDNAMVEIERENKSLKGVLPRNYARRELEKAALEWFEELGYETVFAPDISPEGEYSERENYEDVILSEQLMESLERINPKMTRDSLEDAFRQITISQSPSLLMNNQAFQKMITEGVEKRPDIIVFVNGIPLGTINCRRTSVYCRHFLPPTPSW
jgi:type I restriction-modification system DNA methylase subunit